jgi:hypothetical protein
MRLKFATRSMTVQWESSISMIEHAFLHVLCAEGLSHRKFRINEVEGPFRQPSMFCSHLSMMYPTRGSGSLGRSTLVNQYDGIIMQLK